MNLSGKIFLFFFLLAKCLFSQELLFNIQFFDQEDGLTDRTVFCINQDDQGLIWVGTGNGLCKFDGENFIPITGNDNPLSFGFINAIKKDDRGDFWVHKKGESVIHFDPLNNVIIPLQEDMKNQDLKMLFSHGAGDVIYFKNERGRIFHLNDQHQIVPFGNLTFSSRGVVIIPTPWETLLISESPPFRKVEVNSNGDTIRTFEKLRNETNFYIENGGQIQFITYHNDPILLQNFLYSITEYSALKPIVLKKDKKELRINDFKSLNPGYFRLIKDRKGNIWLSQRNEVWFFDPNGDFKKNLTSETTAISGDDWNSNQIFIDNNDRLWIGSGLGLMVIEVRANPFQQYLNESGKTGTRGIAELPGDRIIVANYEGTKVLDKHTEKVLANTDNFGLGLSKGRKDTIWSGTHGNLLVFYTDTDSIFQFYEIIKQGTGIQGHIPFFDPDSEVFYMGTNLGLFTIEGDSYKAKPYTKLNEFDELSRKIIYFFYKQEEGIWIATNHGIYLLDQEKGIIAHHLFPNNDIKHFHEDAAGDFWLATGKGLIHWDRIENTKKQYTTQDGLSHNVLYAVYEDNLEYLWLPSNNGLMRFNKATEEVVVFKPEDGLTHEEFNTYSHYQATDGRLYFGGLNGLIAFYPEEINLAKNDASFIVTQLEQFDIEKGKLVDKTKEFRNQNKIILKPDDKFFTITFSLLDYAKQDKFYAWKIKGLDQEWNYQAENSIRINGLQYGDFILEVKAKGTGGQWAKNELAIPIQVLKPFYLENTFLILFTLGTLLTIYLIVRWRLSNLQAAKEKLEIEVADRTKALSEKNVELEVLNQTKDKFFAIIAHDLRGPIIALRGLTKKVDFLIAKNRISELETLGKNVDQATARVTKLLDNLLNWAIIQKGQFPHHPTVVNLRDMLMETLEIYQDAADTKTIDFDIDKLGDSFSVYVDKNALAAIIRNLIDNAIKFTPYGGKISFNIKPIQGKVQISIKDTGPGIPKEKLATLFDLSTKKSATGTAGEKGTGLGLVLCKELIEMNNGKLNIKSQIDQGTEFQVYFPIV